MKINEVTQISEINWGAVGSVAKSLGGAAVKGIGKAVAAGLDKDLGKALGAGKTTQTAVDPQKQTAALKTMSDKYAASLAQSWAQMAPVLVADAQKKTAPGVAAGWSDVDAAVKEAALNQIINNTVQSLMKKSGQYISKYQDLAQSVGSDAESQRLAKDAIANIEQWKRALMRLYPERNKLATITKGWQGMMNKILVVTQVAMQRQDPSTATTQQQEKRISVDQSGKMVVDGRTPFNPSNSQHVQLAQAQGIPVQSS